MSETKSEVIEKVTETLGTRITITEVREPITIDPFKTQIANLERDKQNIRDIADRQIASKDAEIAKVQEEIDKFVKAGLRSQADIDADINAAAQAEVDAGRANQDEEAG